jgi:5-methyltetrahydrofolate--homocysteine methyltransferase
MGHIAQEMKRRDLKFPLLIGGATTSRMHTAVKISENYNHGVIHVLDASRAVSVVSDLLNENKPAFLSKISTEYAQLKEDFLNRKIIKNYLSIDKARENKLKIEDSIEIQKPNFIGNQTILNYDLAEIAQYIDWTPFFITWEMHGKFPAILQDEIVGNEATKLYHDANVLLQKIIEGNWLQANAVFGIYEVEKKSDDEIEILNKNITLNFLRQQIQKAEGQANLSLADFVLDEPLTSNYRQQFMGAFVVTIKGIEKYIHLFQEQHDDYNKIMLQALADRLAEAFTELLHQKVRKEYWGYAKDENISMEDLIKEKYQGIRPAPGYPACPDHTEKYKLFELLNATEEIGVELTENLAMYPASSVCGWYFAHPESKYFGVGKIERDQLEDYAKRKGMTMDEATRWLRAALD